jgi:4a-hydroxytetrahydrobiopterin dehydratase
MTNLNYTKIADWEVKGEALVHTFVFRDFLQSIEFVNKVAFIAEKYDHHPDIDIRWNKVRIVLMTHDAGELTEKDFLVAAEVDGLI